MNHFRVKNSISTNNPFRLSNEEDPVIDKLMNMIKKQMELLERIEFYIYKIEKNKLEKEQQRRNQEFLGNKRNIVNYSQNINSNDSIKIDNTINKILDLPSNNNPRKSDKHLEVVNFVEERIDIKCETINKNLFDMNFSTNFEIGHQNNFGNEEFEFFFQKNNFNFDEVPDQNMIFGNENNQ